MKWVGLVLLIALLALAGTSLVFSCVSNPRVVRELREAPDGERAAQVMLLTLPSGRAIPVNYLREGPVVWAGADGRWWRELRGGGGRVTLLIRGEELEGRARAVEDDPELRVEVFSRLRPTAPSWSPFGTLVEIRLDRGGAGARDGVGEGIRTPDPQNHNLVL